LTIDSDTRCSGYGLHAGVGDDGRYNDKKSAKNAGASRRAKESRTGGHPFIVARLTGDA